MALDQLVKLSQISTPFVLVGLGFLLNRSIQNYTQNIKLTSEFNTKWSDEFIVRCRDYSYTISEIQFLVFGIGSKAKDAQEVLLDYNKLLDEVSKQKYKIETHASLVESVDPIIETVEKIWLACSKNANALINGGHADFESIKLLQRELNVQLKNKQKSVLKI